MRGGPLYIQGPGPAPAPAVLVTHATFHRRLQPVTTPLCDASECVPAFADRSRSIMDGGAHLGLAFDVSLAVQTCACAPTTAEKQAR